MPTTLAPHQIDDRLRIVEEHMRAENAHDVDAVMRTFVEDPTFVINGDTISGPDDVRSFYEGFGFGGRGGFADLHVEERGRHVAADAVILEVTVTGKHADTWQGIAATGRQIEVPLCAVFPFDGEGRLTGERVYMDGALLLRQLGVLS